MILFVLLLLFSCNAYAFPYDVDETIYIHQNPPQNIWLYGKVFVQCYEGDIQAVDLKGRVYLYCREGEK